MVTYSSESGHRLTTYVEYKIDHDGELLNEVVLPLMNVSRKMVNGKLNPYEPHQTQFFMTSAGTKATFAYEKCLEVFSRSIINPKDYFCWGCDYRVPMMHGLLDKSYVNDIKTSSTFNEESFARELKFLIALFKFLKLLENAGALYTTTQFEKIFVNV